MRMKHTVKFRSGEQHIFEFRSKTESNKAFMNALCINKTFNTIQCIWIEPIVHPEKRKRIDFDERGYQI